MRIKDEIFCFAHLRWCHNGWASNILIVVDTGYAGIHHSKYWMPIHYDTIEDGQNKKSHLLFSNSFPHFPVLHCCFHITQVQTSIDKCPCLRISLLVRAAGLPCFFAPCLVSSELIETHNFSFLEWWQQICISIFVILKVIWDMSPFGSACICVVLLLMLKQFAVALRIVVCSKRL